ncbi:MAG: peptide-methionine (S)-S-oxide reductase MsrA [Sneathiella sp.]|uniref:peptide-methionine (S)-S-oxide reductase MsrA n=1 Tax=Sneathiella sp. TaxID=1964365 RepID=UPI003002B5FF
MRTLIKRFGQVLLVSMTAILGTSTITWHAQAADNTDTVVLAGGCFWCVESDFDNVPGVVDTVSGYTGGTVENPTYKVVSAGDSGHLEAVKITFDPEKVSYQELLDVFWRSVDPTDDGGQFCDRGESYKTAIYVNSPEQRQSAEISKRLIDASGVLSDPVVTPIIDATTFYPSEEYHQDYYTKNPIRYKYYRYSCGRDKRVREVWGDQAYSGITEH